jgi:hypothetical protein
MNKPLTIETKVRFRERPGSRRHVATTAPEPAPPPEPVPRIARLMALAIHFDRLIREGVVKNYAELARLGGVSRARITQIMKLADLPVPVQERLLGGAEPGAPRLREVRRGHHAHSAQSSSACWSTVFTASSCKSGG